MDGWSEDHMVAIGPINSNSILMGGIFVKLETRQGP
jgi:hypothetical protein